MGVRKTKPYEACPHCLAEIIAGAEIHATVQEHELPHEEPRIAREPTKMQLRMQKPVETPTRVQGCTHHFGYLSTRGPHEKIPEQCMTCENIVQCMLKAVTG